MRRWGTLTTHIQSTATVVNRKQWPSDLLCCRLLDEPCSPEDLTIVTERAMACGRMWPHVAMPCAKDTREKKCNNGFGTICAQLTGVGNTDGNLIPLTTDRPVAPTRVLRTVSCGCKTGCRKTCRCPRAELYCSPMCSYCNGHICSNIHALAVSQDSDNAS